MNCLLYGRNLYKIQKINKDMAQKTNTPKGTRDFLPLEAERREYIFNTIKNVFKKYGYRGIETPAMETTDTLTGKYGEEGDQLLFKILNSRPHDAKDSKKEQMMEAFKKTLQQNVNDNVLAEKALRYDLTVPFARFVVQHLNELTFPFKRYQIQPVWRADRPQKGRYREFYQCDVDVIGSNSLLNELELIQIIDEVFNKLNLKVTLKLNNRKVLAGIAEYIGTPERITDITVAIDKLDKIGKEKVNEELKSKGLSDTHLDKLQAVFDLSGSFAEKLQALDSIFSGNKTGLQGVAELNELLQYTNHISVKMNIEFDITLARGLNYYTGAIFEVKANEAEMGSICGGGRYDDLTGIFGLKDTSGVGISFGADRIYDVIDTLQRFPKETGESSKVMFVNFGEREVLYILPVAAILRENNIACEVFPDNAKMKKQMNYADKKNIPFVVMAGSREIEEGKLVLKNMITGEQFSLSKEELLEYV